MAVGSGDRSGGRVQSLDGGCDGGSEGDGVLGEKPQSRTSQSRRRNPWSWSNRRSE